MATNDDDTYALNGITWKRIATGLWVALDQEGNLLLNGNHPGTGDDDRPPSLTIKQDRIEALVDYLNIDLGIEPKNANPPTSALQEQIARVEQEVFGWDEEHPAVRAMLGDATQALINLTGEIDAVTKHVGALQETMNTVMTRPPPAIPDGLASRDWVEGRITTISNVLRGVIKTEIARRDVSIADRARLAWRALKGATSPISNADGARAAGFSPEQASALGVQAASSLVEKGGAP